VIALGVAMVASLWRTVALQQEKNRINSAYEQAKGTLSQLQTERDRLTEELSGAHQTLKDQAGEIEGLQKDLQGVQQRLDQTVVELSSLQREHESLRQANMSLTTQLASVTQEREALQQKLSSIPELKQAIREIRRKMSDERWAAWRARVQAFREADQRALETGNRGYVLRSGAPTLGARTKLQVHVLEPESAQ
jgi:chromosome segregation ATPase